MSVDTVSAILKNEIHRLVVQTDDEQVLRQVKSVFEMLLHEEEADWWDALSEKEKILIQRGLEQLNLGESIAHEVVRAEIDQMLEKK